MNTVVVMLISLALGAIAWFMCWLNDLLLGDRPPKRKKSPPELIYTASDTRPTAANQPLRG